MMTASRRADRSLHEKTGMGEVSGTHAAWICAGSAARLS